MSQTDRQTDKSTNWAVTAFGNDITLLEDVKSFPSFVKKVYGGREVCPDSGREHFQGHIQLHTQQRLSGIKKWLPTAHLEIARNFKASISYSMKSDTASGSKNEVENPRPFIDNQTALMMLARQKLKAEQQELETQDRDYWPRVRIILKAQPHLCGLFGKPDIYRLWKHTWEVWEHHVREEETIVLQSPTIFKTLSINGEERSEEERSQDEVTHPEGPQAGWHNHNSQDRNTIHSE